MRWRLVRTYIEDLSYNYVHEHRVLLEKYVGHALHSSNDEYCTREVIRRFPLAIHRLYAQNLAGFLDTTQTVNDKESSMRTDVFVNNAFFHRLKQW